MPTNEQFPEESLRYVLTHLNRYILITDKIEYSSSIIDANLERLSTDQDKIVEELGNIDKDYKKPLETSKLLIDEFIRLAKKLELSKDEIIQLLKSDEELEINANNIFRNKYKSRIERLRKRNELEKIENQIKDIKSLSKEIKKLKVISEIEITDFKLYILNTVDKLYDNLQEDVECRIKFKKEKWSDRETSRNFLKNYKKRIQELEVYFSDQPDLLATIFKEAITILDKDLSKPIVDPETINKAREIAAVSERFEELPDEMKNMLGSKKELQELPTLIREVNYIHYDRLIKERKEQAIRYLIRKHKPKDLSTTQEPKRVSFSRNIQISTNQESEKQTLKPSVKIERSNSETNLEAHKEQNRSNRSLRRSH